jgi:PAS domain-containing protein
VITARDIELAMVRLALNNMPHGLCMFDANRQMVVHNKRLVEILGIPQDIDHKGQTVRELLRDCVDAGTILRSETERLVAEFEARLSGGDRWLQHANPGGQVAEPHLPADGERRHGGLDRGRHRAQGGGGADYPPCPLRFAHRPAQPRKIREQMERFTAVGADSRSCSSISTNSNKSPTRRPSKR